MFNFPVAAGTSGHLLGGVLAGFLLGPWAGSVVMATVIGIQALLFQDGGLLALGANIFNMGVIGTLGGTLVARGIAATFGNGRRSTLFGVGVAAWLSVMAAAGFTTLQLGLSGTTDISIGLPAMLGTHALIGLGEAAQDPVHSRIGCKRWCRRSRVGRLGIIHEQHAIAITNPLHPMG